MFKENKVFSSVNNVQKINEDIVVYTGKPQKDFIKEYIVTYDNDFYEPLSIRVDLDVFAEKLHNLSTTFIVVYKGKVAGLLASYFYDVQSKKGFITLVHIKREFQGRHLSSYLVKIVQTYAESIKFKYIDLMVYRDNISAFGLYSKYGFKVINEKSRRCTMRWEFDK